MQINFARREIACKIVFYGPGMSGKTTNLEVIHAKTPRENKGELTCIATEGDRTLFFDFMPLNLGNIRGMNTKFQLYTVPGQVYYNSTRKLVLRGVDGVVFVADSGRDKLDENIESLRNLEENLQEYGRKMDEIPVILQYNKRDRPDAMDVQELNQKLNARGLPWFEAVATTGEGVFDSLKSLAGLVIQNLDLPAPRSSQPGSAEEATRGEARRERPHRPAAASAPSGAAPAATTATTRSSAPRTAGLRAQVTSARTAATGPATTPKRRPVEPTAARGSVRKAPGRSPAKRAARPTVPRGLSTPVAVPRKKRRLGFLLAVLLVCAAGAATWWFFT